MSEMLGLDSDTQNSYFGLMLRDLGRFQTHFEIQYGPHDSQTQMKWTQII